MTRTAFVLVFWNELAQQSGGGLRGWVRLQFEPGQFVLHGCADLPVSEGGQVQKRQCRSPGERQGGREIRFEDFKPRGMIYHSTIPDCPNKGGALSQSEWEDARARAHFGPFARRTNVTECSGRARARGLVKLSRRVARR